MMDPSASSVRFGETLLSFDPSTADDARLAFIGRIRSPWRERSACPKNMRQARETMQAAKVEIAMPYRPALVSLEVGVYLHLFTWLHLSRRDLAEQMPRLASHATGTFSLRSPVRPNPIGLHLVKLVGFDREAGVLDIDAIDVLDGTPVLDLKPYFASIDRPQED